MGPNARCTTRPQTQIGEVVNGAISKGLLGHEGLDDEWIDDEVRKHFLNA